MAETEPPLSLDRFPYPAVSSLYRAIVGELHPDHYLGVFAKLEASNRTSWYVPSWNWAASLNTINWMVFRKMWGALLAYLALVTAIPLLVLGLGRLVLRWPQPIELGIMASLLVLAFLIPGAVGDLLFHARCRTLVYRALAAHPTLQDACTALEQIASTRRRLIRILMANFFVWILGLLVFVLFPAKPALPLAPGAVSAASASGPVVPAASAALTPASCPPVTCPAVPAVPMALPASETASSAVAPVSSPSSEPQATAVPSPASSSGEPPAPAPAVDAPILQPLPAPAVSAAVQAVPPVPHIPPHTAPAVPAVARPYFVNAGLFANPANAHAVQARLIGHGFPVTLQEVRARGKELTRVRVGPFSSRVQATHVITRIRALQLEATLVRP
ncbi:SPOR domain-containing protein [Candidatus Symbiobacter mobilis]|uniref:Sporulation-related protein n=1 Tax=Candidatus Symbiobacter mobilis CR TaxID=946483 RepID=U5N4Q7_9BURK|nr:SPOR domain-containing protein [Candidatus Symbiobacter mobilis]AGX86471.1 sporulation-related protein [Candidatus Symbiobacter mobilis CR]